MNKFITKVAKLVLGLSLAAGVGVAVGSKKAALVNAASPATLTFSSACGGSGTDSDGNTWTITSDAAESTYDSNRGIHYGTGSKAVSYIQLTTSGISGTITQIVVNASGNNSPTLSVTVGGVGFGTDATNLTTSNAAYTFTDSGSGAIVIRNAKSSSATGALYIKSVAVTYSDGGGGSSGQTGDGSVTFGNSGWKLTNSLTSYEDDLGNTWSATVVGDTDNSYTQQTNYTQIGSGSTDSAAKWASSVTFTTTLDDTYAVTAFSTKVGGFNDTHGTVSLKVGNTTVGTGSFNTSSDVTVNASTTDAENSSLTVLLTGGSTNGRFRLKVYEISYTLATASGSGSQTNTFTVSFETNGGSSVSSQTIDDGDTASEPATPTKAKHSFVGWFTEPGLVNEYDFSTPVTDDLILYAKWEQTQFDVIYNANGGTGTMTDSNSPYNKNATVTVLANSFSAPDDSQFDSWNTKADGSGTEYDPSDNSNKTFSIAQDTTLYAQWSEIPDPTVYSLKYTLEPFITGSSTSTDGAYAVAVDAESNDITWSVEGNSSMIPWRIGGKSISEVDREVSSKDSIDYDIKKVELDIATVSVSTAHSISLIVASDSSFNSVIDTVTKTTIKANSTLKFRPTSPLTEWETGYYYKFVFTVSVEGNSNKFIEFSEARFYEEAPIGVSEVTVSAGSLVGTYKGDGHIQCSAQADGVPSNDVVWTLNTTNTYVAEQTSVDGASVDSTGKVTFTKNVSVYVFATSTITTTTRGSVQCTASGLVDAPAFNLITSTDQLFDNMTVIIGATDYSKLMSTTQNTHNRGAIASHQSGSSTVVETYNDNYQELIVELDELSDGTIVYSFYTGDGYLNASGTGNTDKDKFNYLTTEDDLDDNGRFAITIDSSTHVATIEAQGTNENKYLRYNSGSSLFSCYPTDSSVQNASIFAATQSITSQQRCDTFQTKFMHMKDSAFTSASYVGVCDAEDANHETPYTKARDAFNAMPAEAKEYFVDNSDSGEKYYNAYQRLHYWAVANGEDFDVENGEYVLASQVKVNPLISAFANDSSNTIAIIVVISMVSVTAIGGYFFLKKRREQN